MVFLHLGSFTLRRTIGSFGSYESHERYKFEFAYYFGLFCLKEETYVVGSRSIL